MGGSAPAYSSVSSYDSSSSSSSSFSPSSFSPSSPSSSSSSSTSNGPVASSKRAYRDVTWAVLFLSLLAIFVATGALCLYKFGNASSNSGASGSDLAAHLKSLFSSSSIASSSSSSSVLTVVLGASFAIGAAVAGLSLLLIRAYPALLIRITLGVSLVLSGIAFAAALVSGETLSIFLSGFFFVVQVMWVYAVRDRIDFSAALLEIGVECVRLWPATLFAAAAGVLVQLAWSVLWFACTIGLTTWALQPAAAGAAASNGHASSSMAVLGVAIAALFMFYWTSQVISYLVHMTIAGVAATWYFLYPTRSIVSPTWNAFVRASTTSFGSVCLGALVLAVIRTLNTLARMLEDRLSGERNNDNDDERSPLVDIAGIVLLAILRCFLSLMEAVVEFVNTYAFARMAIYGGTYWSSSRDAIELIRLRSLDLVVNDSLVSTTLSIGALLGGVVSAIGMTFVSLVALGGVQYGALAFAFLVGASLTAITLNVVDSCVLTLFVCLAEDPQALQRTKPEVHAKIVGSIALRYPQCDLRASASTLRTCAASTASAAASAAHHTSSAN